MNLICIECPRGCAMEVNLEDGKVTGVSGNYCVKGKKYAMDECVNPKRVLTTTVRLTNDVMLPVKTSCAVEKSKLLEVMKSINRVSASPPIKSGQVLSENIDGDGTDLLATKSYNDKD